MLRSPLKILVISNFYPPAHIGGYEIACRDTVDFLRSRGHDVQVLCGNRSEGLNNETAAHVSRTLQYIDYAQPSFMQSLQVEYHNHQLTRATLEQFQPQLVYLWNQQYLSLGCSMAVQKSGLPKLYEIGDFWPRAYLRNNLASRCKRMIKTWLPGLAYAPLDLGPCIAVSQWVGKELQENFQAHDITVIPNGTHVADLDRSIANQPARFLIAGRLCAEKGVSEAIKAFTMLCKHTSPSAPLQLDCIGPIDNHYKALLLEQIRQAGMQDCIHILPPSTNMKTVYESHDVLLMPTMARECFGLVIIEAMAHGMAVIANNHYGPAEIINDGKNGLLVTPGDVGSLYNAMQKLVDQPALFHSLAMQGFNTVRHFYDTPLVKARVENLLQTIIDGGTGS
jgi:glycosyltransferase involved in cell wall biosynthesis